MLFTKTIKPIHILAFGPWRWSEFFTGVFSGYPVCCAIEWASLREKGKPIMLRELYDIKHMSDKELLSKWVPCEHCRSAPHPATGTNRNNGVIKAKFVNYAGGQRLALQCFEFKTPDALPYDTKGYGLEPEDRVLTGGDVYLFDVVIDGEFSTYLINQLAEALHRSGNITALDAYRPVIRKDLSIYQDHVLRRSSRTKRKLLRDDKVMVLGEIKPIQ